MDFSFAIDWQCVVVVDRVAFLHTKWCKGNWWQYTNQRCIATVLISSAVISQLFKQLWSEDVFLSAARLCQIADLQDSLTECDSKLGYYGVTNLPTRSSSPSQGVCAPNHRLPSSHTKKTFNKDHMIAIDCKQPAVVLLPDSDISQQRMWCSPDPSNM